jgi:hypothetical protein
MEDKIIMTNKIHTEGIRIMMIGEEVIVMVGKTTMVGKIITVDEVIITVDDKITTVDDKITMVDDKIIMIGRTLTINKIVMEDKTLMVEDKIITINRTLMMADKITMVDDKTLMVVDKIITINRTLMVEDKIITISLILMVHLMAPHTEDNKMVTTKIQGMTALIAPVVKSMALEEAAIPISTGPKGLRETIPMMSINLSLKIFL